jgi:hypothetical protein
MNYHEQYIKYVKKITEIQKKNIKRKMIGGDPSDNGFCFIVSAVPSTAGMLQAFKDCLPGIIEIMKLTKSFRYIQIIFYRDYDLDEKYIVQKTKWIDVTNDELINKLLKWVMTINSMGGGDIPEAIKSALLKMIEEPYTDGDVYVLHITSNCPHMKDIIDVNKDSQLLSRYGNQIEILNDPSRLLDKEGLYEQESLGNNFDWINLCNKIPPNYYFNSLTRTDTIPFPLYNHHFYSYLAFVRNGKHYIFRGDDNVNDIRASIEKIINGWFGIQNTSLIANNGEFYATDINDETLIKKEFAVSNVEIPFKPELAQKLRKVIDDMKTNEDFYFMVGRSFDKLLDMSPMTIAMNDIFGRLWRIYMTRRDNEHRNVLVRKFIIAKSKMTKEEQKILEDWTKKSYDASDEIELYLKNFVSKNGVNGLVRYSSDNIFDPKSVAGALLKLSPENTSVLMNVLARLSIDDKFELKPTLVEELPFDDNAIPFNLPPTMLFKYLMHVASPGTALSIRMCVRIACLCINTSSILQEKAKEFLTSANVKGKWLDFSLEENGTPKIPENFEEGFLTLIYNENCREYALTDGEAETVKSMLDMAYALRYFSAEIIVDVNDSNRALNGNFPTYVEKCPQCNVLRPIGVYSFVGDKCGYCHAGRTGKNIAEGIIPAPEATDPRSQFQAQCNKCMSFFPRDNRIQRVSGLIKCHACQNKEKSNSESCIKCHYKYIMPRGKKLPNGLCASCADGLPIRRPQTSEHPILVSKLFPLEKYGSDLFGIVGFCPKENEHIHKLPLHLAMKNFIRCQPNVNKENTDPGLIRVGSRTVADSKATWKLVIDVMKGIADPYQGCSLCAESLKAPQLFTACGNDKCTQRICDRCGINWYSKNRPGKKIYPRNLKCPFCSRFPTQEKTNRWGPFAMLLKNQEFRDRIIYGFCIMCKKVDVIGDRQCCANANDNQEEPVQFICSVCNSGTKDYKECPKCGVLTDKIEGCDHITCPNCNAHWCWKCRFQASTGHEIYDHLVSEHGRIFDFAADAERARVNLRFTQDELEIMRRHMVRNRVDRPATANVVILQQDIEEDKRLLEEHMRILRPQNRDDEY